MKGQVNNRTSNSKPGGGLNGHRRSNSRFNGNHPHSNNANSTSHNSESKLNNDRLLFLLSTSIGHNVVATVTSGARYQGLLLSSDVSAQGTAPLSVVLSKPTILSKPLIDEKSNLDKNSDLTEKIVIEAKDLIDLEVSGVVVNHPQKEQPPQPKADQTASIPPKPSHQPSQAPPAPAPVPTVAAQKPATPSYAAAAASATAKLSSSSTPKPPAAPTPTQKPAAAAAAGAKLASAPVPVNPVQPSAPAPLSNSSRFKTDSDISSRFAFKERELQRWVPDENTVPVSLDDDTFGDLNGGSGGHWDQFKVNEERFGVQSTYDEHLYTTRINTSAPDFKERVARAERLAKEIESSSTNDRHILEERGIQVDYGDEDEEDKYSGVDRRGNELMAALRNASISNEPAAKNFTPGKYVPPKHRAAQYHNDPAIISSSATGKYKKQSDSATQSPTPSQLPELSNEKSPQPHPAPIPAPIAQANQSQVSDSTDFKQKQGERISPAKPSSNPTATPSSSSAVPTKPNSIPPKPPVANQYNESFRLNAQSEINSLREFSANFKIPHKMPTDLLPILAKDKLKQDEILKKQQEQQKRKELAAAQEKQKQEEQQKQKQKQKSQPAIQPPTPQGPQKSQSSSSPAQPSSQQPTPSAQKKKMDPTKPAFKLNPKAAAFTPFQRHNQLSPNPPKANYQRSPINPSPRMNYSRPYSGGSISNSSTSGGGSKKYYQISPADFFGGADRVPSKEGQKEKVNKFKTSFNLFVTAQNKHEDKSQPLVLEKAFHTPPTWSSTIEDSHASLYPPSASLNKPPTNMMIPGNPASLPFIPSPLLAAPNQPVGGVPGMPAPGYPGAPNGPKYALSPHHHHPQSHQQSQQQQQQQAAAAMAHFQQQQQFHAAMMYQQQQFQAGVIPPGQPPMPMYPPGAEAAPFLPPGGFMVPPGGYVGGGSPVNVNAMMLGGMGGVPGAPIPYGDMSPHNYNNHHHNNGGRRFNNNNHGGKRSSNS